MRTGPQALRFRFQILSDSDSAVHRYDRQGFHGAGSALPNASESAPSLRATLRLRANAERDRRLVGRPRHPDQVHEEHVLERQGLHERLVVEREDAVPGSLACQGRDARQSDQNVTMCDVRRTGRTHEGPLHLSHDDARKASLRDVRGHAHLRRQLGGPAMLLRRVGFTKE